MLTPARFGCKNLAQDRMRRAQVPDGPNSPHFGDCGRNQRFNGFMKDGCDELFFESHRTPSEPGIALEIDDIVLAPNAQRQRGPLDRPFALELGPVAVCRHRNVGLRAALGQGDIGDAESFGKLGPRL